MAATHSAVHQVATVPGSVTGAVDRVGLLEDWRLAAVLLGLAVLVAVGWGVAAARGRRVGRRPRHPVPRRLGLAGLVGLMAVSGIGLAVNSYAGYAPDVATLVRSVPSLVGVRSAGASTLDAAVPESGGRYPATLFSIAMQDPADRIPPGRTWIYLPAGYSDPANAHRRYPVAYLLHGYPSSSYDWFGGGRVARTVTLLRQHGLLRPMILVAPDVSAGTLHDTECLDSTVGGPRIETFLTHTVVGTIDRGYRTMADRSDRVIAGVSSGGYCALNVGFRHQGEFGVILGLMPYGDPGRNAVGFMFGGDEFQDRLNSPSAYAATMPLRDRQFVFLAAGRNDREASAAVQSLARTLAARGVFVAVWLDPAGFGHTWREGRRQAPYALTFASAHLGAPPAPARRAHPLAPGGIPPLLPPRPRLQAAA